MVIDDRTTYLDYGVYGLPETFSLGRGLDLDQKYICALTDEAFREHQVAIGKS